MFAALNVSTAEIRLADAILSNGEQLARLRVIASTLSENARWQLRVFARLARQGRLNEFNEPAGADLELDAVMREYTQLRTEARAICATLPRSDIATLPLQVTKELR